MNVTGYIPIHPNHEKNMFYTGGFEYRGDHLVCPEGKKLRRNGLRRTDRVHQYVARHSDCQQCPVKTECLPTRQKRRYIALSMYHPVFMRARERNRSKANQREMLRRRTTVEGVFASLDRLVWARSRLRGLWKVNCEGYISALAHNLKKAVRRLADRVTTPTPTVSGESVTAG